VHAQLKNGDSMVNLLMLILYSVFVSLNLIDAIMTRCALENGYEEQMKYTKVLIAECGLNRAMLIKSLLPVPFIVLVIVGWGNAIIGIFSSILFLAFTIYYSYVFAHNCIQLIKKNRK